MSASIPGLPAIAVVTCSFKQARFIEATMRSVLDQAYPALQYAVIDGGSRDGSVEIIRSHVDQLAYWVSEPDEGQSDALIKGFDRTDAPIMGWLCSDDLLLPGALHAIGTYFRDHPEVDAVFGDSLWIDQTGSFIRPKREMRFNRFVLHYDHNYIPQPSMFWRRALYQRVGGLDRRLNLTMDGDLWSRFSRHGIIRHIARYLSCMRYYPAQKTRALRADSVREDHALRRRFAQGTLLEHLPETPLRAIARGTRVVQKTLAGGYGARVPTELIAALERYRIHSPA